MMATITIGGKTYVGNNISINNNVVKIDGKIAECSHPYVVSVSGDVDKLEVDSCESVTVAGAVQSVKTMSGDVKCGEIRGSVQTMSGDVDAKAIHGPTSTMSGDITVKS
jgi:hypothetical protein